ncbi:MAG: threonylcarbamoyl-AMP synthase [Sandarakinorhabdus sp.]|nr:threonylcarbamoyl-AMP synthase [Sandarakinorhabdus sp.]
MTRLAFTGVHDIAAVVRLLAEGGIAAIPTETVYGLAADAASADAVARVYAAKGRPQFNPLIVHVADRAMAERYAKFSMLAERLAASFWPGPLTLVLPLAARAPLCGLVTAGLPTVALRVPAHPAMQAVVRGLGRGVAAPSANLSGRLSPTTAAHVLSSLGGKVPLIVDGGPCSAGLESSIVAIDGDDLLLLRHGAIALDALEAAAGKPIRVAEEGARISAPGMMLRHYAPGVPVRMFAQTAAPQEFHIGFGEVSGDRSLSRRGNLAEAAARLFETLHAAEASGKAGIAVAPIPETGLGMAINDRLRRAARG